MAERETLTERQIAVLIDLENISLNLIQWLFDQISDEGRITIKKAYADWSLEKGKRDYLLELGIEAVPLIRSTSGGKNASDIRLAIDTVDLLYTSPVDIYVIVSSDSDFIPLVSKLRAAGKIVFGAGERNKAPKMLIKSYDRYFFLDQGIEGRQTKTGKTSEGLKETESLMKRAIEASKDEYGRVLGTKLHQTILRLDPSFDFHSYGYSSFIKFVEASPGVKVTRSKGPGDFFVELRESSSPVTAVMSRPGDPWEMIDSKWSKRLSKYGNTIPGPIAAADAAAAVGVSKLSASSYKTLQGLLNASDYLSGKWARNGNTIIKR